MGERVLAQGNIGVGWGALNAGCRAFFGYPITPQNETTEFFARELPARGGVFVQAECEGAAINMLYAAAGAGIRAMTSTSSPGWSLMQEGISNAANAELPFLVVLVQRGGPGSGTTQHSQMDYNSVTRGGGHGGYRNIVLAPASVQESHDLTQLAFHLADRYRNPVIMLTDALVGQMREPLQMRTLDFAPLPEKDWAVRGRGRQKDGQRRVVACTKGVIRIVDYPTYLTFLEALDRKFRTMKEQEVRCETYRTEDAELIVVSFGYASRVSREAVNMARSQGLRVGLIRPITLWPFPVRPIREKAAEGCRFLVVEDNLGQMVEDVEAAVQGRAEVHLLGALARHAPMGAGMILPERVLQKIVEVIKEAAKL